MTPTSQIYLGMENQEAQDMSNKKERQRWNRCH